jgi:outer membrane protein assembly factor BamE (lipoprotein component of BamABCDE complex)
MTTVDFKNAKAKFKASPGFRTKEARILAPMITQGMTKDQVRDILGEPDKKGALQSLDSVGNYSVFYSQVITVTFENDRVMKTEATGIE